MSQKAINFTSAGIAISSIMIMAQFGFAQPNIISGTLFFLSLSMFCAHTVLQIWDDDYQEIFSGLPIIESKKRDKMMLSKTLITLGYFFILAAGFTQIAGVGGL